MAEQNFPVKLLRASDGARREAGNVTTLNQLVWDGFQPEAEAKQAAKAASSRTAKTTTSARGKAASSGDSAPGEKTVGTNPA